MARTLFLQDVGLYRIKYMFYVMQIDVDYTIYFSFNVFLFLKFTFKFLS